MKQSIIVVVLGLLVAGFAWRNAVGTRERRQLLAQEEQRQHAAKLAEEQAQRRKEEQRLAEIQSRRDAVVNPIAAEYRPKFAAIAERLKPVMDKLPDPSTIHTTWKSHAADLKVIAEARHHVEHVDYGVLMQALGQPIPTGEVHLDFPLYTGWVPRLTAAVGNRLAHSLASTDKTGKEVREAFQYASEIQYLVVARPVSYVKPTIIVSADKSKPNSYITGEIVCVVYVIDVAKYSLVTSFRLSAQNSSNVEYEYSRDESKVEAGNRRLLRDLRDTAEIDVVGAANGNDPIKF